MVDPKDMPATEAQGESAEQKQPKGAQPAPEERIAQLEQELKQKSEEAAANFDRYLRAVADAENFKKRLHRDKAEAIRYANETLLRDLLHVVDNLELAVEHAPRGEDGKSVVEGVELTLRMFRDILERQGVKQIVDPTGSAFDPATQEASDIEASTEFPPNTVIRCQVKGYRYNDRLLRPARVVVAMGPSPREQEPDEDENEPLH